MESVLEVFKCYIGKNYIRENNSKLEIGIV